MIYPELFGVPPGATLQSPPFLDLLFVRLAEAGVETIDLRPALSANKVPYLYIRDDNHWSPRAVAIAAAVIAEYLRAPG